MKTAAIITAAGNSTRFSFTQKKEYAFLDKDKSTVLSHIVDKFLATTLFDCIVITIPANSTEEAKKALLFSRLLKSDDFDKKIFLVEGKSTRQESIFEGLKKLTVFPQKIDFVFIHDGARPWIEKTLITAMYDLVKEKKAVVPIIPSTDTQKEIDNASGKIVRHLPRNAVFNVQTPQSFAFDALFEAYTKAHNSTKTLSSYTDDSEIWADFMGDVYTITGCTKNKKITFEGDLQ
ncbi:MAG: IspD/TarI family cytidylyltransferase [Treponemataceae bacterium]